MEFKYIDCFDIEKYRYIITTDGQIFNAHTGFLLKGNNPKNEKGYVRVTLKTQCGSFKKFPLHVLVMRSFSNEDPKAEVNHIDGNKLHCEYSNLEYTTRLENAHHAAIHNLYKSGEDHYRSILSNDQVHSICKLFQSGKSISEVMQILDLSENYFKVLNDILHKNSWTRISDQYDIDFRKVHYKTYEYEDLDIIAYYISTGMKNRNIVSSFPQYDQNKLLKVVKKMKSGKLYRSITQKYF